MAYVDYVVLPSQDVQNILKKQSILVYGVPNSGGNINFDERGLEVLCPLDKKIEIQCKILQMISRFLLKH